MMKVLVEPKGLLYETDAQSTLLEAALRSGVVLPNSCRNGTCRTCICLMRSGSVAYRIEWPGLSFDEKREGYILPCVAVAQEDVVIESPAAKRKDV
jgi:ferredoxin